jgi:lysophospholipase L1-like esterase
MPITEPVPSLDPRFARYVALGDSSTEGLDDPDGRGGFRGWSTRLAEGIAGGQGRLLYANLAVRGYTTRQILETQLEPALAMRPDLVTLFSGTNDVTRRRFDAAQIGADIETMQRAFIGQGATLLTLSVPDLTPVMPGARWFATRVERLNQILRDISARTGALLIDLAEYPVARDPRLMSEDRLHANALGHQRIAAAMAQALRLPGSNSDWSLPLPQSPAASFAASLQSDLHWCRSYLLPWLWRQMLGRSLGDGRAPTRPLLRPVPFQG